MNKESMMGIAQLKLGIFKIKTFPPIFSTRSGRQEFLVKFKAVHNSYSYVLKT